MPAQQNGTGFINEQDIVGANQDNQLGNTIQSGVQNDVNNVQNNVNTAQNQFQTQFNQGNTYGATAQNQALANQDVNNAANANAFQNFFNPSSSSSGSSGSTGTGSNSQSSSGSTSSSGSSGPAAADVSAFQQFLNGNQYSGPTQLSNYSQLQNQGQNIAQLAQDTNTQGGQYNLLKQYVGQGQNYNQGDQALDSAILGQTGQQNLANVRQAAQGINQNITQAGTQDAAQAATQQQQNQAYAQQLAQQLAGQTQSINSTIGQQVNSAQAAQAAQQQAIQNFVNNINQQVGVANGPPQGHGAAQIISVNGPQPVNTPEEAVTSGLQNLEQQGLINSTQAADLNPLIQQGLTGGETKTQLAQLIANNTNYAPSSNINAQGVMTADEVAQLNALAQLSGNNQSPITSYGNATLGTTNLNLQPIQQNVNNAASQLEGSAYVAPTVTDANIQNGGQNINSLLGPNYTPTNLSGVGSVGEQQAQADLAAQQAALAQLGQSQALTPDDQSEDQALQKSFTTGQYTPPPVTYNHPGFGSTGTIICTELNRQGLLSDDLYALDKQFAKEFMKVKPEAYRGYLMIARPIVRLMRKYSLFAKAISYVLIPWAKHMAHEIDASYEDSLLGKCIQKTWSFVLPKLYRAKTKLNVCLKLLQSKIKSL